MSVLAIIPARSGSKGIPGKNWTRMGAYPDDNPPVIRAMGVAFAAGCDEVVLSTDHPPNFAVLPCPRYLRRPAALAQDDTPMIAVVQHVLEQIPGPPDQPIVLLQPTQPLRKPEHITQALELLTSGASSVVSVARIPQAMSPPMACWIGDLSHYLCPFDAKRGLYGGEPRDWSGVIARRQDAGDWYYRDGTVYAFWRKTVDETGTIYGHAVQPLIIDPAETCPLDTPDDWLEAERRLRARNE